MIRYEKINDILFQYYDIFKCFIRVMCIVLNTQNKEEIMRDKKTKLANSYLGGGSI